MRYIQTCEVCGMELPDNAVFCGNCGTPIANSPESPTSGSVPAVKIHPGDSTPTISTAQWEYAPPNLPDQTYRSQPVPNANRQPLDDEEEDENRRNALFGIPGQGMQPPTANVPMVQGSPQFGGVPSVQGSLVPSFYSSPTIEAPHFVSPPPSAPGRTPRSPRKPHSPHTQPAGCAPAWLIFLFAIILILTSIFTLGLTVLAPSLSSLSGNTNVTIGGTLQLHGTSFVPGISVTLTIDNGTPLYYTGKTSPIQANHTNNDVSGLDLTTLNTLNVFRPTSSSNIVSVGLDGSFTVTIAIDTRWHTGQHTIRAAERWSQRSAFITINVQSPGQTPTATPSVTVSPSATANGLSCVNPTSVALGPVSENDSQAVTTQVSLCTAGTGAVNWTATWDQDQAAWLQLDQSSGQIQAPATQPITVSASATNLPAGNYTATITFSSSESTTTETLAVSFTVQTGCIRANPQQLSFTGVAGVSDAQPQTVTLTNCGLVGTWASALATDNNVNWLTADPTGGSLNGSATQSVTVTTSNLKAQLSEDTYSGSITFSIGTNQVVVSVTLTVQAGPKLVVVSPNPPSFDANKQCTFNRSLNVWVCFASISNSSQSASLTWKSSSTGVSNITFKPATDTLAPGAGERVTITIPGNNCQTPSTLTFTGPVNAQNIAWSCTSIS
jgi:hypothetical protein